MMRTVLNRGFSQRSQMEVELLATAWMLLGGNGGGRMGGNHGDTLTHTFALFAVVQFSIFVIPVKWIEGGEAFFDKTR